MNSESTNEYEQDLKKLREIERDEHLDSEIISSSDSISYIGDLPVAPSTEVESSNTWNTSDEEKYGNMKVYKY